MNVDVDERKSTLSGYVKAFLIICAVIGGIAALVIGIPILSDWALAEKLQERQAEAIYSSKRKQCVWVDAEEGKKYVNGIIDRFLSFDGSVTVGNVAGEYPVFSSESGPEFELSWTEMTSGNSILIPKDTKAMYSVLRAWEDGAKRVRKALKEQVPTYGTGNKD